MQVNVNILDVTIETLTNKVGKPYKIATVDYKDLDKGKAESRKVMSFGPAEKAFVFLASQDPRGPHVFTMEKVGEYWNIVAIAVSAAGAANKPQEAVASEGGSRSFSNNDDKRQLLIVRQSCINYALTFFELTKQTKVSDVDVVNLAEKYKDYVFGGLEVVAQNSFDEDVPL